MVRIGRDSNSARLPSISRRRLLEFCADTSESRFADFDHSYNLRRLARQRWGYEVSIAKAEISDTRKEIRHLHLVRNLGDRFPFGRIPDYVGYIVGGAALPMPRWVFNARLVDAAEVWRRNKIANGARGRDIAPHGRAHRRRTQPRAESERSWVTPSTRPAR